VRQYAQVLPPISVESAAENDRAEPSPSPQAGLRSLAGGGYADGLPAGVAGGSV
jgi:hypothetical protein